MNPFNIFLLQEGEDTSELRTRNAEGQRARNMLIDRGNSLILQAALTSVTHGDFTPDGDGASLLIFEFSFIGKGERRFTSGQINISFEDAMQATRNCPMVTAMSPSGKFAINKTTSARDIHQGFNASLGGGPGPVTGELGFIWEQSEIREDRHATTVVGLKRSLDVGGGKTNTVSWIMEEDPRTKEGIPSFLRGGILLRRRADVPFRFTIKVKSEVDFGGKLRRLFGREEPDPVDPVELDEETDLDGLGIGRLDPDTPGLDLHNMGSIDVAQHAHVVLASLLNVPG
ncbi:hypothetical protein FVER53590_25651 [Fusarium verticillioides]|nr:hypothetical protein FVER14953_20549 [Fusarium verticillioides]RBR13228.1 hypothetical protein FVER53590_25651 [Fusarium verticillioides]